MNWIHEHRASRPYAAPTYPRPGDEFLELHELGSRGIIFSRQNAEDNLLLADQAFNNHERNGGRHVSPYDEGRVDFGRDNLVVRLIQGINEEQMRKTLRRAIRATNGIDPSEPEEATDPEEMFKGGLQTALESQVIVFEVIGASRVLTHQLVRSRRAAFHQQSQRATWYGDRPNQRWPQSVMESDVMVKGTTVEHLWEKALLASWDAYKAACDAGISYQDARYILPEGTTNYILCEYSVREFINVYAYRGCSMFQWEMVDCARKMREALVAAHPFIEPYVKISCEKGPAEHRKCTFQGWENVEEQCDFPWAKQDNRVFLPAPRNRIGA